MYVVRCSLSVVRCLLFDVVWCGLWFVVSVCCRLLFKLKHTTPHTYPNGAKKQHAQIIKGKTN